MPRRVDDFSFEQVGQFRQELLPVSVGVLREHAVGNNGTPVAEEDVAAVEVDIRNAVGRDAVGAAGFGRVGAGGFPFRLAPEVGGGVTELHEFAGGGLHGHVVAAPYVARAFEETAGDAVLPEEGNEAVAGVGETLPEEGGEIDDFAAGGFYSRGSARSLGDARSGRSNRGCGRFLFSSLPRGGCGIA